MRNNGTETVWETEFHEDGTDSDPEDVYHGLAPHERRNLQMVSMRRDPPACDSEKFASTFAAMGVRLDHAKADATWRNWGSVANNFRAFDNARRRDLPEYDAMDLDQRMIFWVEMKIDDGDITAGTPVRYVKRLEQLYRRRCGASSPLMADYRRALIRDGLVPGPGATPTTYTELLRAVQQASQPTERMQLLAMWLLAGRCEDARRLKARDCKIEERDQAEDPLLVKVTWLEGAPKRPGEALMDYMVVPSHLANEMTDHLHSCRPNEHPFTLSSNRITELLRAVNPELTSHSLKKGALRYLVVQGRPLHEVMHKARHSSEKQTRDYLGEELFGRFYDAIGVSSTLGRALDVLAGIL